MLMPTNTDYQGSIEVAKRYSQDNPDDYVLIVDIFGLQLLTKKRLSIDSLGSRPWYVDENNYGYYKNGKYHNFTDKQRIAYQNYSLGKG
jgi:hypothetical protein